MHVSAASRARFILAQFAVVALGIVFYFGVRGLTEGRPAAAVSNARDVVAFESHLGLDQERHLQHLLTGRDWLTDLANWVYIWGHWPVITVVMVWLAWSHRLVFLRLRNAMLLSGAVGLVVYATYPVAPPRLLGLGLVDTVSERSRAYRWLQPPAFVNQYAAMPSLHVGWDLLVGIAVFTAAGGALLRWVGVLMPALMAAAVVLTANHYLVDGIAGSALALAGLAGAVWLERRRTRSPGGAAPPSALPRPRSSPAYDPLPAAHAPGD
jgi:hypothetical protein